MKIKNQSDFIHSEKKYNLEKISSNNITIIDVDDIWDGPLSGYCRWQNMILYFYCFDQLEDDGVDDRWPRKYLLLKLTPEQETENKRQYELFTKWQKGTLTQKEYVKEWNNFPEQVVKVEQVVGWFDSGETKKNKFMDSYFNWQDKHKSKGVINGDSYH